MLFVLPFKGVVDIDIHHPKIAYLRNALLVDEEKLSQLEIKVGILGHNRSDYDIMLMPHKPEEPIEPTEIDLLKKKSLETRRSIFATKITLVSVRSLFFFNRNTNLNWIHGEIESLKYFYFMVQRNKRRSKFCPRLKYWKNSQ